MKWKNGKKNDMYLPTVTKFDEKYDRILEKDCKYFGR